MSNYAIYQPKGKAGEYSYWACNFFVGCSNDCSYCYCKKGLLAHAMGGIAPKLKKCFKDEDNALIIFLKEMLKNLTELQKHGLFFTFTSDPMLPETVGLTMSAVNALVVNEIPVKILTKRADWVDSFLSKNGPIVCNRRAVHNVAFGFTLTGHDKLEPGASTNAQRIEAMKKLHDAGFKTFASIEPIIDFESSLDMIKKCAPFCDLFKIGLMSGQKIDNVFIDEMDSFIYEVDRIVTINMSRVYWKDSISKHINCNGYASVGRDFNLFNP